MKLRPKLDAEKLAEGFTPENDIFSRADLANRLTSLLTELTQSSVSVLDGRWGIGKSTFVKMWISLLEKNGIPAIYFDAFAYDFISEPFQAVSSAFIKTAIEKRKTNEPVYKAYLARTAAVAKRLAAVTTKAGVKLATLGAISASDLEELTSIGGDLSASAAEVSEEAVKALLEQQASSEIAFAKLRESLQDLPSLFSASDAPESQPKLIVIIDELDRCRPDFALGIVETLKHFFRIDNIHFVLVTNMRHLEMSVSQRYGISGASGEYLQKFYDFVIHFDQNYDQYREGNVRIYVDKIFDELVPSTATSEDRRYIVDHLKAISHAFRLTLRQIEGIVGNVVIALIAAREREFRPHLLISFLCALKLLRPDIYVGIKSNSFDLSSFKEWLETGNWVENYNIERVTNIFRYYSDPTIADNDPEFEGWGRELWNYNLDRPDVLRYLANSIIDRFGRS